MQAVFWKGRLYLLEILASGENGGWRHETLHIVELSANGSIIRHIYNKVKITVIKKKKKSKFFFQHA